MVRLGFLQRRQKPVQMFVYPGPQGARRIFFLIRRGLDRHHHFALYLSHSARDAICDAPPPRALNAEVSAVGHDERRPPCEPGYELKRWFQVDRKQNAALCQLLLRLLESFKHECIVPLVRTGIPLVYAEGGEDRNVQFVSPLDGIFQGVVAAAPLRLLHPVKHISSVPGFAVVKMLYSFGLDHELCSRVRFTCNYAGSPSAAQGAGRWQCDRSGGSRVAVRVAYAVMDTHRESWAEVR